MTKPNRLGGLLPLFQCAKNIVRYLLIMVILSGGCSEMPTEGQLPLPVKAPSWHNLAGGIRYMELEHGWLVKKGFGMTFVPLPAGNVGAVRAGDALP
jgi:hypothetical protein